jgi:Flp pilus assembly pilin Flp
MPVFQRRPFGTDARGASLVEYILVVGLVAVVCLLGFRAFGRSADDKVQAHAVCVGSLACGDGSGVGTSPGAAPVAGAMLPSRTTQIDEAAQTQTQAQTDAPEGKKKWEPVAGGQRLLDVGKGIVIDGAWGTITGVYDMVTDLPGTWEGLKYAATHPIEAGGAIKDSIVAAWEENPDRFAGQAIFEVATFFIAPLKIAKAAKLKMLTKSAKAAKTAAETGEVLDTAGDVAKTVDKTSDVAKATKTVDQLQEKAKPFTNAEEIPGGAGGVMSSNKTGKYLRTQDIQPGDLPYESAIRPAQPVKLADTLDEMPQAKVKKVTDTFLASDEHSGSAGVVRLAELEDGRPVATKTYYPSRGAITDEEILSEARSAQLFSDLGIGPKYHGIYRDADGRLNVVMDVVPGDFSGTKVTAQTFDDLETVGARLKGAGIEDVGDFQLYRTQDGRLVAIDPGYAADAIGRKAHSGVDDVSGFMTRERMQQLGQADPDVGQAYLDQLKQTNPKAYESVIQKMKDPNTRRWMGEKADEYVRRNGG